MPVQVPPKAVFLWPDLIAKAMPCVKSLWTGEHVPPARIYASRDMLDARKESLAAYTELSVAIYAGLSLKSNEFLKSTLRRRVTDGVSLTVGGNKETLVKKILTSDRLQLLPISSFRNIAHHYSACLSCLQ